MWFQQKYLRNYSVEVDHYPYVGPYDFHDVENADRNTESGHK